MSDETQNTEAEAPEEEAVETEAPETEPETATEAADAPEPETADSGAAQEGGQDELDPFQQIQDLNDKLLRAMAEVENTRRISAREKADASKYAVTNFARDILRVADFLTMAMQSVSDEARENDANLNNLYVGIDMTMKELLNVFEAQGIKPVRAEGQPFDHNVHEAVQQAEDADVPANTVLQVLRPGFTIQDRLLRPAQVIVSTGGPKANGADEAAQDDAQAQTPQGGQGAYEGGGSGTGQSVDQET